jgi:hypothetical protein
MKHLLTICPSSSHLKETPYVGSDRSNRGSGGTYLAGGCEAVVDVVLVHPELQVPDPERPDLVGPGRGGRRRGRLRRRRGPVVRGRLGRQGHRRGRLAVRGRVRLRGCLAPHLRRGRRLVLLRRRRSVLLRRLLSEWGHGRRDDAPGRRRAGSTLRLRLRLRRGHAWLRHHGGGGGERTGRESWTRRRWIWIETCVKKIWAKVRYYCLRRRCWGLACELARQRGAALQAGHAFGRNNRMGWKIRNFFPKLRDPFLTG